MTKDWERSVFVLVGRDYITDSGNVFIGGSKENGNVSRLFVLHETTSDSRRIILVAGGRAKVTAVEVGMAKATAVGMVTAGAGDKEATTAKAAEHIGREVEDGAVVFVCMDTTDGKGRIGRTVRGGRKEGHGKVIKEVIRKGVQAVIVTKNEVY